MSSSEKVQCKSILMSLYQDKPRSTPTPRRDVSERPLAVKISSTASTFALSTGTSEANLPLGRNIHRSQLLCRGLRAETRCTPRRQPRLPSCGKQSLPVVHTVVCRPLGDLRAAEAKLARAVGNAQDGKWMLRFDLSCDSESTFSWSRH